MANISGFLSVCVVSIYRICKIAELSLEDGPWTDVEPAIWSIVEVCVGILCACLPTFRPLFVSAFQSRQRGHRSTTKHKSYKSTGYSNSGDESAYRDLGRKPLNVEMVRCQSARRNDGEGVGLGDVRGEHWLEDGRNNRDRQDLTRLPPVVTRNDAVLGNQVVVSIFR